MSALRDQLFQEILIARKRVYAAGRPTPLDRIMQAPAITRTDYQSYSAPQWNTQWQTYQPRVSQFYANVNTRVPANFQRTTRHEVNAAERKIEQGARKANRKLD